MKEEKKKLNIWVIVAISVVAVLAIVGIVVGIVLNNKNKDNKVETVPNNEVNIVITDNNVVSANDNSNVIASLKEDKIYKGIKISNIQLTYSDGETKIVADVENVSGKDIENLSFVTFVLYNQDNLELGEIPAVINSLDVGEKTQVKASITIIFSKAVNYKIVENKKLNNT